MCLAGLLFKICFKRLKLKKKFLIFLSNFQRIASLPSSISAMLPWTSAGSIPRTPASTSAALPTCTAWTKPAESWRQPENPESSTSRSCPRAWPVSNASGRWSPAGRELRNWLRTRQKGSSRVSWPNRKPRLFRRVTVQDFAAESPAILNRESCGFSMDTQSSM